MFELENQNNQKNLLIIPLSTFDSRKGLSPTTYLTPEGDEITTSGYQLEPIPKYLRLHDQLDAILAINTESTILKPINPVEKKDEKGETTGEYVNESPYIYFGKRIEEFNSLGTKESKIELLEAKNKETGVFEPVVLTDSDTASDEDINKIIDIIQDYAAKNEYNVRILYDNHGGPRVNSEIMNVLFSLLSCEILASSDNGNDIDEGKSNTNHRIIKISPDDIYSCSFNDKSRKIIKAGGAYKLLDLVSGVHEFIEYGKAESLQRYSESNPEIKPISNAMKTISDGLSMGRIETFNQGLDDLKRAKSEYKPNDILSRLIDQEYAVILNGDLVDYIRWNTKKQFYQFAMTLCESKMIGFLGDKNIIDLGEIKEVSENSKSKNKEAIKNNYLVRFKKFTDKELDIKENYRFFCLKPSKGSELDYRKCYFLWSKEDEYNNALEIFLEEHRAIKNTRNHTNHASDNTDDSYEGVELYEDVISVRDALYRYLEAVDNLVKGEAHYEMCYMHRDGNYKEFCKKNPSLELTVEIYSKLYSSVFIYKRWEELVLSIENKDEKQFTKIADKRVEDFVCNCKYIIFAKAYYFYFIPEDLEEFEKENGHRCYFIKIADTDLAQRFKKFTYDYENSNNSQNLHQRLSGFQMISMNYLSSDQEYKDFTKKFSEDIFKSGGQYGEFKKQIFDVKANKENHQKKKQDASKSKKNSSFKLLDLYEIEINAKFKSEVNNRMYLFLKNYKEKTIENTAFFYYYPSKNETEFKKLDAGARCFFFHCDISDIEKLNSILEGYKNNSNIDLKETFKMYSLTAKRTYTKFEKSYGNVINMEDYEAFRKFIYNK